MARNKKSEDAKLFCMRLGRYIRSKRLKFWYALNDIEKLTGISRESVAAYEKGKYLMNVYHAAKIANILCFDLQEVSDQIFAKGWTKND